MVLGSHLITKRHTKAYTQTENRMQKALKTQLIIIHTQDRIKSPNKTLIDR